MSLPAKRLAFFYPRNGPASVDQVAELPIPSVENLLPGQLLLKIHASSLNPVDFKQRGGGATKMLFHTPMPAVHGYDFVGTIVGKSQEKTDDFALNDVVFGMVRAVSKGCCAQYCVVDAEVCVKKPPEISDTDAASIPLVGITCVRSFRSCGLVENNPDSKPIRVLILGGAGGVGTCAIQLAKHLYKCSFIATTASPGAKTDLCKELGADLVVNYRDKNEMKKLSEIEPFDCIYDTVGTVREVLNVVAPNGHIVSIAEAPTVECLRDFATDTNLRFTTGVKGFIFSSVGKTILNRVLGATSIRNAIKSKNAQFHHAIGRGNREIMTILSQQMMNGTLKAIIDSVFPLKEAKEAMAKLESGHAKGKIVIDCSS